MADVDQKTLFASEQAWTLWLWPLVIVIEDCFVPLSAQLVIETISEQSDETCGLLFALAGMKASGEICCN